MVPAPDSRSPLPSDTLIGPWRLLEHLNSGAFGRVYLAVRDDEPDSPLYALKLARRPADARFEREAELLSRIQHLGVARLLSSGTFFDAHGRPFPYLVMHYVHGEDLYDWGRRRQLTSRHVLHLMAQVARALEATHLHGVHRDVKGDNVRVSFHRHAILLDFGACWFPGARPLTDTAVPPGTEPYRSHQIIRFRYQHRWDKDAHYRFLPEDDLYALGVMAYYLVTGDYPPAPTDPECDDDPWRERPRPLQPPSDFAAVLPELERFILRLLSEEPTARGTAGALARELEQAAVGLGPEADKPITTTSFYKPTEPLTHPGPPPTRRERMRARIRQGLRPALWLGLAAIGLNGVSMLLHMPSGENLASEDREALLLGEVDREKTSLGSTTMDSEALPSEEVPDSDSVAGEEVPRKPLKGQKRPPCNRGEVELNKGCWVPSNTRPPCPSDWFEWEKACYLPIILPDRPPTSEER